MANGRINYSDIKDTCDNLTDLASSLNDTIDTINSTINKITDPTWDGIAATSYVENIRKLNNHLPDANRQLALSVFFLAGCANGYKKMDEEAVTKLKDIIGGQEYIDNYDVKNAPEINPDERIKLAKEKADKEPIVEENQVEEIQGQVSVPPVINRNPLSQPQRPADNKAEKEIESLKKGEKIKIPKDLKQDSNKTIKYDNRENEFEKDSNEEAVKELWEKDKKFSEEGLALIEVDKEERYLIRTSEKYGKVGDSIDVELEDESVIKCVIAETKDATKLDKNNFGTLRKDDSVSIISFEKSSKIEEVKFPWNVKSNITEITNNGSILNRAEATKVVEGKTFPPVKSEVQTTQDTVTSNTTTNNQTPTSVTSNTNPSSVGKTMNDSSTASVSETTTQVNTPESSQTLDTNVSKEAVREIETPNISENIES